MPVVEPGQRLAFEDLQGLMVNVSRELVRALDQAEAVYQIINSQTDAQLTNSGASGRWLGRNGETWDATGIQAMKDHFGSLHTLYLVAKGQQATGVSNFLFHYSKIVKTP